MNYRTVFHIIGRILLVEAALMLLPMFTALIYREDPTPFIWSIIFIFAFCLPCLCLVKRGGEVYARDGFIIVALTWIFMSVFGALPFMLSGAIPRFVDAFFETVSGFTTTGSTIMKEIEHLPKGILFWRSFTHWVGGMGVLVFVLAIIPLADSGSMHIMRAEVPGPTKGKLVPRMKSTAKLLYGIYIVMTLIEVVLLVLGGMPLFDSLVHSFGTAGTGGFSIKNVSIGYYNSTYIDTVITVFMLLFGIYFSLYYLILLKNFKEALLNEELRWYIGIFFGATLLITMELFGKGLFRGPLHAFRYAAFQVSSIMTTTGYATTDFQQWPTFSKFVLLILMLLGACAGSTGGGMKTSRLLILFKALKRELKKLVQPHAVSAITLDGKAIEEQTVQTTLNFFFTYMLVIWGSMLFVAMDGHDVETTLSAVVSCVGNIGPGLGVAGPMGNFSTFSDFSKLLLSVDMLLGRLEIFPIIMLVLPSTWRRRR